MLLILVEVSVKLSCLSMTAADYSKRAITMLLILVEVSVKLAYRSTIATDCSYLHITYSGGSICESGLSVHNSHRLQAQGYHHATYSGGNICEGSYLIWWKYLWKWLGGPREPRLQPQSYHHATYSSGSICESGLSVHDSHRLQPHSYLHITYSGGSICESGLSVHDSHRIRPQSYHHAIYSRESGLSVHYCSQRAITMLELLLPSLEQSSLGASTAPGFVKIYSLISHICDIYKAEQKGWKESHSGAMVCKCDCILSVCVFFQEINDQHLWSKVCSAVIEGNSVVFKECTIDSETTSCNEVASSGSLPRAHGDVDVVAGQVDNSGEINWSCGVQLLAEDEVFELYSPIGV